MIPQYFHDCEKCIYLGGIPGEIDFYYCPGDTLITRYSSDPSDYRSGTGFAPISEDIAAAAYLALNLELITLQEIDTHCNPHWQTNQLYFQIMTNIIPIREKLRGILEKMQDIKWTQEYGASAELPFEQKIAEVF